MDKVIIDGVDVSGCMFYEPKAQVMTCHEESITKRCDRTNCYYKQLKRKELECSSLIDEIAELREQLDDCYKPCKDCSTTHSFNLEVSENKKLKAECEKKDNIITDITKGAVKYRKALEDIKSILDTVMTKDFTSEEIFEPFKLIDKCRNKINEVIGAE